MSWKSIGSVRENVNVEILVDGEKLDLGQFRMLSLFDSTAGANGLFSRGSIDQAGLDQKLAYIADKRIKYDVSLAPQSGGDAA